VVYLCSDILAPLIALDYPVSSLGDHHEDVALHKAEMASEEKG
jgi:hypothetical protein